MTDGLEERVRANPDDVEAWVILGDQLQEAGDQLGELIALAHQREARMERQAELRGQVLEPLARFVDGESLKIEWRHGVPHRACLTGTGAPLDLLGALPAARFIRELELNDLGGEVAQKLDEGFFDSLARLDFEAFDDVDDSPQKLGAEGARELAGCRRLAQLESLKLGGQLIGDKGVVAIARADLSRLRALSLINNDVRERGIEALANCERLAGLRELNLHYNSFGDVGIAHLAESRHLTQMTSLTLGMNGIRDSVTSLIRSPNLAFVEALVFGLDDVGNATLEALASSPHARKLSSLTMHGCGIDDAGLQHLASSALLLQLRELGLQSNKIGDAGVVTLTRSLRARDEHVQLRELNLELNPIGDDGMVALAECPHLQHLGQLWLWGDAKHTRGIDALLGSKYLSKEVKKSLAWQFGRGPH